MKSYWFKEIASVQFFVAGAPVQFEPIHGNRGVLVLESPKDDALIGPLEKAASQGVGGIVKLNSEAEYLEKKEQAQLMPSQQRLRGKEFLRQAPKGPFAKKSTAVAGADAPGAAPVKKEVPPAMPFTKSAISQIKGPATVDTGTPPAPNGPGEGKPESAPVVEGFRPATRRISRKPAPVETPPVPA
jgi:hypothetical protein